MWCVTLTVPLFRATMATSATEEEFLQVLDEMNRICGAEEGKSSVEAVDSLQMPSEVTSNRDLSGLGFMEEEEDDDEEEDHRDKGPSISDVNTMFHLPTYVVP